MRPRDANVQMDDVVEVAARYTGQPADAVWVDSRLQKFNRNRIARNRAEQKNDEG